MKKNTVKIIDTDYNEILSIKDGSTINIKYPDGHTEQRTIKSCGDECHFYVNGYCYHYYQFAQIIKRNGYELTAA